MEWVTQPTLYNGHACLDAEYKAMAATLYEKLAHTDVIGIEHAELENTNN